MIEDPIGYVVYIDAGNQGTSTAYVPGAKGRDEAIDAAVRVTSYLGDVRAWAFEIYEGSGRKARVVRTVRVE